MRLPGRQEELIEKVAAVNPRTVVVLQTGGPVEMPWLDKVSAVLEAWYPGQEAGNAIADVLFGDAEPGGRPPAATSHSGSPTIPPSRAIRKPIPARTAMSSTRKASRLAIAITMPMAPSRSFPSDTASPIPASNGPPARVEPRHGPAGVAIELDVTNIGDRAGAELVQLYVKPKASRLPRPVKELKAFAKLHIAAGETATARLTLSSATSLLRSASARLDRRGRGL